MTKEEFQELLQRYKAGRCSTEEIEKINGWFDKISDETLELNEWEKGHMHQRMLSDIRATLPSSRRQRPIFSIGFSLVKVAASITLIALIIYVVVNRTTLVPHEEIAQDQPSTHTMEYKNATAKVEVIRLPDSSTVRLGPHSEISYEKEWTGQQREVHLVGEAFFEVVKDSRRPFYVYGGDVVTKVLGTSFSVKAAKNAKSIEVSVRTGKVSVYEETPEKKSTQPGNEARGVVLTPNEKVEYFVVDKHWVTSLVEEPKPLPTVNKAQEFVFNSTPMTEIIKSIERTYSIDIILENEASDSCTFTGDVSMMELYDILEVICKSTGTNYEVRGTKILITGRGCQ